MGRLSPTDRKEEIRKVRVYVKNAKIEIDRLGIIPRVAYKYPFDIVGLSSLSKAFAIAQATLKLLASNYPDEAFGLSRSLVEVATNLRYLTVDPAEQERRTREFVRFTMADKAFWYHHALESATTEKEKAAIRAYAKEWGIADDPKSARQHWSGKSPFIWNATMLDHPLDGAMTQSHRKKVYAVDYYRTSTFVHCSAPAIVCYCTDDGVPFHVSASSGHLETHQSTLFLLVVHLQWAIDYVLEGLNIQRPAKLNALCEKTLKNMKAVPHAHRASAR
jgi:hypothetical protein